MGAGEERTGARMPTDEQRDDEAVLREAVLRGSEAAWRTLYDRYFDSLYGYVRWRMKGDTPRTEDVLQECWFSAVRAWLREDLRGGVRLKLLVTIVAALDQGW